MKDIKKYIKSRIKDKKLAEKVINMVTCEKHFVPFDPTDVKAMLDKAKEIKFISGSEKNIIKKIENPEKVTGVMMLVEANRIKLDHIASIGEKVTENLDGDEVDVIWSARENKKLSKARISAVQMY